MGIFIGRTLANVLVMLAVFASFALTASPASADPVRDSAKGRITQVCSVSCSQVDITFSAVSSAVGTAASGTFKQTLTDRDPNVVVSGDVTCLRVAGSTTGQGNLASIGGVITKGGENVFVFDPNTFTFGPARGFIIQASDNGKFAAQPDTFSFQYLLAPVPQDGCPAPTVGFSTVDGNDIVIENALP